MMVLLVWLHVLAAVSWIGGTIFLSVVLVPVLKHEPFASQKALLFRTTARRFALVVWSPWIARCSLLLMLAVLLAAVVLVRS